ncbi:MAG: peroxidase family protein [Hyphomicrobiales bacterium]|nr:peroxidase family protein [Hyphomicrobiales bacterium]
MLRVLVAFLSTIFRAVNLFVPWFRLPISASVANIVALQHDLRRRNLFSTERSPLTAPDPGGFDIRGARTADGSYNDLSDPAMGMRGMRFGRNVPLKYSYGEKEPQLFTPNPRLISTKLLARKEFIPVPSLNLLAAAWLQFMTHDWFSHGTNDANRLINVPLPDGDTWSEPRHSPGHISVQATFTDPVTSEADADMPAAYRNFETHWWDGSQIYGSTAERLRQVRSDAGGKLVPGGKLHLEADHRFKIDPANGVEMAGVNIGYWLGLSIFMVLLTREHNAIADHLKADYPNADDEWIFNKARLINAALMTKIHTVEWTPSILNTPALRYAMRGNWWGVMGEAYEKAWGREAASDLIQGIPGSNADHHSAMYSMTEEFISVYRMHSLIPDDMTFRRLNGNAVIETQPLQEIAGKKTPAIYNRVALNDIWHSFAIAHPGLLRLHNYPNALRKFKEQDEPDAVGQVIDLATIDILRDRERGVPRYCEMRRRMRMRVPATFLEMTGGNEIIANELAEVYDDIEDVDLLVGCHVEPWPEGFGFSDTAFRFFIVMATRRIKSDRFYTDDFNDRTYTPLGMQWIRDNGLASIISRHMPELSNKVNRVSNAFFPWPLD